MTVYPHSVVRCRQVSRFDNLCGVQLFAVRITPTDADTALRLGVKTERGRGRDYAERGADKLNIHIPADDANKAVVKETFAWCRPRLRLSPRCLKYTLG
jgi:hypothetical protein